MSIAILISVIIVETTAAVLLAILSVSLLRQLKQKTQGNQLLIAHTSELEAEATHCRKREADAGARLDVYREWYRAVINNMQDIVLVHGLDEEGRPGPFVEANDVACTHLGFDREALLSRSIVDIHDIEIPITAGFLSATQIEEQTRKLTAKVVQNAIDKAMRGKPISYEDSFRTGKGTKLPLHLTVIRSDLMDQPMIIWVGRDITEIREGRRAVKESQQRMEDFFSNSPLGIAVFDADRRLVTVNRAGLGMFGMPDPREFEHFNLFDNRFLPPDAKQTLGRGESIHCEIVVDFVDVWNKGVFSSHRRDKGHFEILISNLGCDKQYRPRGYFAQIEDVTQKRKIEADLRRLQTTAMEAGVEEEGIGGSLEDVELTDIIQVFCAGGRNMELSLIDRGVKAQIFMQTGSIIHCTLGDKTGEEAFYELMRWKQGKFTAKPCAEFPERTIKVSAMSLLMEGARRLDEVQPE